MMYVMMVAAALSFGGPGGGANLKCMAEHCAAQSAKCIGDKTCDEALLCSAKCMQNWDKDPTPEKFHAQNCTTKCGVTYMDETTNNYMSCMMEHNCITFPPINVTCPVDLLTRNIQPTASLATLTGEWWQHWGKNELWDCYPCQHIHSMYEEGNKTWAYTYSYELFLVNGSLQYFQQTWQLPDNAPGTPAPITYTYMGTLHNETWYILDSTDRYVVLVDCSYMFAWTNVGSIVWVRPHVELTDAELSAISAAYARIGWNFPADFCKDRHGDACYTPPNATTQRRLH